MPPIPYRPETPMDTQPPHRRRGLPRFVVRVCHLGEGFRPYAWEIYDDDTGAMRLRSEISFRTSREAFAAGTTTLSSEFATGGALTRLLSTRLLGDYTAAP
jgi:hypothetical protein